MTSISNIGKFNTSAVTVPVLTDNQTITTTSDIVVDRFPFVVEPTTSKGLERYIDLDSITPEHIKRRPDIMEIILMFQDYLNNGYKMIPHYEKKITYTIKDTCISTNKEVVSRREPFDHNIQMSIDRENNSMDLENTKHIEEYDSSRDIATYISDEEVLTNYVTQYDYDYIGSYYYDRYKYYTSIDDFISVNGEKSITTPFNVFIATFDNYVTNNSDLNNQFVLISEAKAKFPTYVGNFEIYLYFCGLTDFANNFKYTGPFSIESNFYPIFNGQVDIYNHDTDLSNISGAYANKASALAVMNQGTDRFRVKISGSGSIFTMLDSITYADSAITILLGFSNYSDFVAKLPNGNYPILSKEFKIIKAWQDPVIFYNTFSGQNKYRVDNKSSSILEKIHRIAYNKDPNVIDFEYIQFVAAQMGYNIDIQSEDIENNQYYTTQEEKENAMRAIIKNLPEFYRIKCTQSGLESLLLSFGIVGKVIYLYTIGNSTQAGYADFVDSRLIEGYDNENMPDHVRAQELMNKRIANPSIASSVLDDWFPSPHFKVELDLLKQRIDLDGGKLGFSLLNKAIAKTKPINTVFRGFYGTMLANFGYIFLHNPKLHMTAYTRTTVSTSCIQLDTWDSRCNDG